MTRVRWYDCDDYEQKHNTVNVDQKIRVKTRLSEWFVQSDKLRDSYDSFKMLETAKSKEYLDATERTLIKNKEE